MNLSDKYINGDCMDYLPDYPDNYFDLAIVDPPYGINVNVSMGRRKKDKKSNYHKFHGEDKLIPQKDYFDQLFRVSQNQIIWGGNYMTDYLYPSPCWMLWDKGFSEDVTFAQFEMAWSSFNSSAKKFKLNAAANLNKIHPTQKPVALYKWLLKNYAKQGDLILDTHVGSASSLIAFIQEGFDFIGFEIDKDYYQESYQRVIIETSQTQLTDFCK